MGKTYRNYGIAETRKNDDKIIHVKHFTRLILNTTSKSLITYKYGEDASDLLSTEYFFLTSQNYKEEILKLSNELSKPIMVKFYNNSFTRNAETNNAYHHSHNPHYFHYKKAKHVEMFFPNENNKTEPYTEGIKIMLNLPSYLDTCEYRKTPNVTCMGCFLSTGRTTDLKGYGHKSSMKTKGMYKQRNKDAYIYYTN